MIGGDTGAVDRLAPIFDTLAPGVDTAERTPGRERPDPSPEERGWLHCGPSGAGHFVKMVHNGIEYGLMAAYAEGLNVLAKANIGAEVHEVDAETAPLEAAQYYQYDIDLSKVTEVWRRGSVISSWLLDLTADALHADPELERVLGRRQRLRRGSLDDQRGHRRGRAGAGPVGRPVRTVLLTGPGRCGRQGPVRHARRLRRPPRTNGIHSMNVLPHRHRPDRHRTSPTADALVLFGATGDLAKRKLFPALYRLQRSGRADTCR